MAAPRLPLDKIFDRSGAIRRPPAALLANEIGALLFDHDPLPAPDHCDGDGHVVLVVPGFLTTDAITRPLRRYLDLAGYRPFGWALGVNWGPTPQLLLGLRRRFDALRRLDDGKISVIGVSLGGLLVRDLAYDRPDDISHVITLASPFRLPTASALEPLVQLCAPFYSAVIDPGRLRQPLPVPATAFYTRDDGLVAWETCRSDDPDCTAIEVGGAHLTICSRPQVLREVARVLSGARSRARQNAACSGANP